MVLSGLEVRTAGPADVPTLATLRRAWTEEQVGGPVEDEHFPDAFAEWYDREADQRVTWLASLDARPVGMLNMLVFTRMPKPRSAVAPGPPRQWGYVANLYVEKGVRDRSVGRTLLDAALEHADALGFARVVLSPSERSVPFYLRAGFAPATTLLVRPAPVDDRLSD